LEKGNETILKKVAFKLNDVGMVTDAVGRYW
jgi:hypothetical protein